MALNVATSIVDWLKSQGKESSFTARRKMYGQTELGGRLGEFVGSGQQNVALLNYLKKQTKAPKPTEIAPAITEPIGTEEERSGQRVTQYLTQRMGRPPTAMELSEYYRPKTLEEQTGMPSKVTKVVPPAESAADILAQITGTPEYKLFEEEVGAGKEAIERGLAKEKKGIQTAYERRGIPSAGMKGVEIEAAETEAAAEQLGISRRLAGIVTQAIREEQEETRKAAEETAETRRKALETMGYVEVGGELMPTLARERLEIPEEPEIRQVGKSLIRIMPDGTTQILYQAPEEPELRTVGGRIVERQPDGTWRAAYTAPTKPEKEKVVPWSEGAAKLGIVGMPYDVAMQVSIADAQKEEKDEKERAVSAVRANVFSWINEKAPIPREQLLEQLFSTYGEILSREEVATEVYGLTTPYEGRLTKLPKD